MRDLPWTSPLALPVATLALHGRRIAEESTAGLDAVHLPWLPRSLMVTLVLYVVYLTWR